PPGDSYSFTSGFSPGNLPYATNLISGPLSILPTGPISGQTVGISIAPVDPFALTNVVVITLSSGTDLAFGGTTQAHSSAVPEPASCILLGIGGLGLLGYYRRKSRQIAA